jgi:Ca-activated chloride channel family protein
MIHFAWPWLFLILPLPWLARRALPPVSPAHSAALRVPFPEDLEAVMQETAPRSGGRSWVLWIAAIAWVLLVGAAARPQWLGDPVRLPVSGRDLMLAVDLSGSMAEQDFHLRGRWVDRLTATKWVAGQFIRRREGDRIGLILFGERAYLQVPLSFDRDTVHTLLEEAEIGLAGKATAIGNAIGLAVKRLRGRDEANRVLVLLTDGANTAGEVEPLEAAELAAREGLKIYTIGIGADARTLRDLFGTRRINPSADLDEATLQAIAEQTGGRYFRARDLAQLEEIYGLLDRLEPAAREERHFRPRNSLYPWPLAIALTLAGSLGLARVLRMVG